MSEFRGRLFSFPKELHHHHMLALDGTPVGLSCPRWGGGEAFDVCISLARHQTGRWGLVVDVKALEHLSIQISASGCRKR